ncbi:MAG: molybdopterin cofactor-binding domain-containing protein, partial [Gemmatimonadales bacterium]
MANRTIGRRGFLVIGVVTTGALVALYGRCRHTGHEASAPVPTIGLSPLIRIGTDGIVTVTAVRSEMGQGTVTALAMLVAEELEVELAHVRIDTERFDPKNGDQGTTASSSMPDTWEPQRTAGAVARELLVAAAAAAWGISPDACRAEAGNVREIGGARVLGYGALVRAAATLPVPKEVPLKAPSRFRLLGR